MADEEDESKQLKAFAAWELPQKPRGPVRKRVEELEASAAEYRAMEAHPKRRAAPEAVAGTRK